MLCRSKVNYVWVLLFCLRWTKNDRGFKINAVLHYFTIMPKGIWPIPLLSSAISPFFKFFLKKDYGSNPLLSSAVFFFFLSPTGSCYLPLTYIQKNWIFSIMNGRDIYNIYKIRIFLFFLFSYTDGPPLPWHIFPAPIFLIRHFFSGPFLSVGNLPTLSPPSCVVVYIRPCNIKTYFQGGDKVLARQDHEGTVPFLHRWKPNLLWGQTLPGVLPLL